MGEVDSLQDTLGKLGIKIDYQSASFSKKFCWQIEAEFSGIEITYMKQKFNLESNASTIFIKSDLIAHSIDIILPQDVSFDFESESTTQQKDETGLHHPIKIHFDEVQPIAGKIKFDPFRYSFFDSYEFSYKNKLIQLEYDEKPLFSLDNLEIAVNQHPLNKAKDSTFKIDIKLNDLIVNMDRAMLKPFVSTIKESHNLNLKLNLSIDKLFEQNETKANKQKEVEKDTQNKEGKDSNKITKNESQKASNIKSKSPQNSNISTHSKLESQTNIYHINQDVSNSEFRLHTDGAFIVKDAETFDTSFIDSAALSIDLSEYPKFLEYQRTLINLIIKYLKSTEEEIITDAMINESVLFCRNYFKVDGDNLSLEITKKSSEDWEFGGRTLGELEAALKQPQR